MYDGRLAFAKGWGHTKEDGIASDFLRHVTKRILNQSKCRQIYKFNEYQDHMLCAYEPGKGTCQVFSTQWVTKFKSLKIELIIWCYDRAIVAVRLSSNRLDRNANMNKLGSSAGESVRQIWRDSFVRLFFQFIGKITGCARQGYPGVFMRVTSFLPWIKMNTQY
jgi:hypothetical protein